MTSQNNFLFSTDLDNSTKSALNNLLVRATVGAKDSLQQFATESDFDSNLKLAFGNNIDTGLLQKSWAARDLLFPEIEIVNRADINNVNGAFARDTNKIYLAQEFLSANINNLDAVSNVVLEEYGHFVDSQLNVTDAPGDEGAIFAALVQDEELSESELQQLRNEDDTAVAVLDGRDVAIEANANLGLVASGLNDVFDTLQNAVNSEVFGNNLPLFGNSLQNSTAPSIQFIDELKNSTIGKLQQLENPTAQDIANTLKNSLGDIGQVQVDESNPNDIKFSLTLGKSGTDSIALANNLGFPGLGTDEASNSTNSSGLALTNSNNDPLGLGLELNASANTNVDYDFNLDFGVDDSGFYLDTTKNNDIVIDLNVSNPSASGKLGALEVNVTDNPEDNSSFTGTFNVDLQNNPKLRPAQLSSIGFTELIDGTFDIDTDINLDLETIVNGSNVLPSVGADLNIDWEFTGEELNPLQLFSDLGNTSPTFSLDNVEVCLGPFFNNFARPILKTVQTTTKPIQPIVDALTTPIDLGVKKITLLDIAESLNYIDEEDNNFIKSSAALISLINSIPTNSDVCINLGNLNLSGDIRVPSFDPKVSDSPKINPIEQLEPGSSEGEFYSELTTIPGKGS